MNDESQLRILHFRRLFSLLSESFIYDPLCEAQARGVDVRVLTLLRMHQSIRPFEADFLLGAPRWLHSHRLLGMLFASPAGVSSSEMLLWPALRPLLQRSVTRIAPDVVHAHFGPDGCIIEPIARRLDLPLIVTFYGYDVSRLVHNPRSRWHAYYHSLFESASALVAISDHIAHRLLKLGAPASKVIVQPLGVDLSRFTYRDPAYGFEGPVVRCLHVGRLTEKKSPINLIRAIAHARTLIDGQVDLRLTIVGDGELRSACKREARAGKLKGAVRLVGAVRHDRIANFFRRSHLYTQHCVTASNGDTEGLGVSFIEASASGLPVISTVHNGIPQVVQHEKTGLLSPEGDVEAMGQNIAHVALRPELWTQMGQAGRAHVEEQFSLDGVVDRQLALAQHVAERHAPGAASE